MSENYIMLNGKRIDLTDEQIEKLGLKVEQDCFERNEEEKFYAIGCGGTVVDSSQIFRNDEFCGKLHKVANYCTDKKLMEQRAVHETLSRLLWRFSMQNNGDKIDWGNIEQHKYKIYYDHNKGKYLVAINCRQQYSEQYYHTKEIAKRAIDEIILPFMKKHPDFVW